MTSATFPRKQARTAVAAAGLAAALALTGCSGDDGDDSSSGSGGGKSASPSASSTETAGTGGGSGSTSGAKGELEGSWLATTDGKAVALVITGTQAGLFATGGTVCSGTAAEESGTRMIRLKCTDGNKDREVGMVDSVSGTSLKVTWEGGLGKESYTKSEGGQIPTGLATANLGS
ncbi:MULTISPECIES: hypothetical protein [Streptomyces]|uniref:Serine/threonine protein kinase n=1 Tax=Streptomyces dengpaensis TaxID=2049881 RepID=A0ABM6SSE2_9ACTN|nr:MULTISPECIES: hypothetical protein [Streptomyces]AVH57344.1 hypothetical protein C4B68_17925 [Streptomyces dengpaensis]PIB05358.1 hypothetical protein B1C81_28960 [Streptomyces sp. HG99]